MEQNNTAKSVSLTINGDFLISAENKFLTDFDDAEELAPYVTVWADRVRAVELTEGTRSITRLNRKMLELVEKAPTKELREAAEITAAIQTIIFEWIMSNLPIANTPHELWELKLNSDGRSGSAHVTISWNKI